MTEVEIAWVEATPRGCIRVHAGIPLAALHQHRRVGDQRVAADVVEVKMRVDACTLNEMTTTLNDAYRFALVATPTPTQAQAFNLLDVDPTRL